MFRYIPVDIFCTQINGDVEAALKILDARPSGLKTRSRTFDWEFSLDPDNPVTQVSKTPSDEEFPCDFNEEENASGQVYEFDKGNELSIVAEKDEHVSLQGDEPKEAHITEEEGLVLKKIPENGKRSKSSFRKSKLLVHDIVQFVDELKMKINQDEDQIHVTPSYCACRFELPIDKTRLEGLSPLDFLVQYCLLTESRKTFYGAQYEKYRNEQSRTQLLISDIKDMHKKLYREPISDHDILLLNRLLDLKPSLAMDKNLFRSISCLMERVIIANNREESSGSMKNPFEVADFNSLHAKLHKINVTPETRYLLDFIRTK